MSIETKADDCEALLRILADGPEQGVSVEEMRAATKWDGRRIHSRLIDIGRSIVAKKVRDHKTKESAMRYRLKSKGE